MKKTPALRFIALITLLALLCGTTAFALAEEGEVYIEVSDISSNGEDISLSLKIENQTGNTLSFGWVESCKAIVTAGGKKYSTSLRAQQYGFEIGSSATKITVENCDSEVETIQLTDIQLLDDRGLPDYDEQVADVVIFDRNTRQVAVVIKFNGSLNEVVKCTVDEETFDNLFDGTGATVDITDKFADEGNMPVQPTEPVNGFESMMDMQDKLMEAAGQIEPSEVYDFSEGMISQVTQSGGDVDGVQDEMIGLKNPAYEQGQEQNQDLSQEVSKGNPDSDNHTIPVLAAILVVLIAILVIICMRASKAKRQKNPQTIDSSFAPPKPFESSRSFASSKQIYQKLHAGTILNCDQINSSFEKFNRLLQQGFYDAAAVQAREICEMMVDGIRAEPNNNCEPWTDDCYGSSVLLNKIRHLERSGLLHSTSVDNYHQFRKIGNKGAHSKSNGVPVTKVDAAFLEEKLKIEIEIYRDGYPDRLK